jgi:membrane-associated phospholipid phosphatase
MSQRVGLFLRARFSPEGLFGLHLTIGSAALIGSAWLFGGVAEDLITGDPLTLVDVFISEWFRVHATPSLTAGMTLVSSFVSTAAVLGLCTAAAAVQLWKRWWYGLLAMALVVPGGVLLNFALKMAFVRARPGWGDVDLLGYSFPSGHTMTATLLYGLLGAFFLFGVKSWWWRTVTVALVFMIVGAVGFSRIYLGAHYFSDVVAAFAAGAAWLAICLTAVETLKRHRHPKERRMSTTVQTGV